MSNVIETVVKMQGVGEAFRQAVTADLEDIKQRTLISYSWKFNMAEGTLTTTSSEEYTLFGGTGNTKNDLIIIDTIRYGSHRVFLDYLEPTEFDMRKSGSAVDSIAVDCFTIRKTDKNRYPIIELNGTVTSGETIYFDYRKKPGDDVSEIFPPGFDSVWRHYLMSIWLSDPGMQLKREREYRKALGDMKRLWIDMTTKPPSHQRLTMRQMELAQWLNTNYS